eukprot:CAMPEP_0194394922 /NCGR_PEP_ID=MMETSP0174-20130528/124126_1 /TAXON_ID=216777 /ORGANISM="Proboscia alata, Strain PI-D3" /LENGTH=1903 /DNA_ID=CAMNT_0039190781 /DNA_START=60 /DNA_END=5771 /DNA_ORIENTATION=-
MSSRSRSQRPGMSMKQRLSNRSLSNRSNSNPPNPNGGIARQGSSNIFNVTAESLTSSPDRPDNTDEDVLPEGFGVITEPQPRSQRQLFGSNPGKHASVRGVIMSSRSRSQRPGMSMKQRLSNRSLSNRSSPPNPNSGIARQGSSNIFNVTAESLTSSPDRPDRTSPTGSDELPDGFGVITEQKPRSQLFGSNPGKHASFRESSGMKPPSLSFVNREVSQLRLVYPPEPAIRLSAPPAAAAAPPSHDPDINDSISASRFRRYLFNNGRTRADSIGASSHSSRSGLSSSSNNSLSLPSSHHSRSNSKFRNNFRRFSMTNRKNIPMTLTSTAAPREQQMTRIECLKRLLLPLLAIFGTLLFVVLHFTSKVSSREGTRIKSVGLNGLNPQDVITHGENSYRGKMGSNILDHSMSPTTSAIRESNERLTDGVPVPTKVVGVVNINEEMLHELSHLPPDKSYHPDSHKSHTDGEQDTAGLIYLNTHTQAVEDGENGDGDASVWNAIPALSPTAFLLEKNANGEYIDASGRVVVPLTDGSGFVDAEGNTLSQEELVKPSSTEDVDDVEHLELMPFLLLRLDGAKSKMDAATLGALERIVGGELSAALTQTHSLTMDVEKVRCRVVSEQVLTEGGNSRKTRRLAMMPETLRQGGSNRNKESEYGGAGMLVELAAVVEYTLKPNANQAAKVVDRDSLIDEVYAVVDDIVSPTALLRFLMASPLTADYFHYVTGLSLETIILGDVEAVVDDTAPSSACIDRDSLIDEVYAVVDDIVSPTALLRFLMASPLTADYFHYVTGLSLETIILGDVEAVVDDHGTILRLNDANQYVDASGEIVATPNDEMPGSYTDVATGTLFDASTHTATIANTVVSSKTHNLVNAVQLDPQTQNLVDVATGTVVGYPHADWEGDYVDAEGVAVMVRDTHHDDDNKPEWIYLDPDTGNYVDPHHAVIAIPKDASLDHLSKGYGYVDHHNNPFLPSQHNELTYEPGVGYRDTHDSLIGRETDNGIIDEYGHPFAPGEEVSGWIFRDEFSGNYVDADGKIVGFLTSSNDDLFGEAYVDEYGNEFEPWVFPEILEDPQGSGDLVLQGGGSGEQAIVGTLKEDGSYEAADGSVFEKPRYNPEYVYRDEDVYVDSFGNVICTVDNRAKDTPCYYANGNIFHPDQYNLITRDHQSGNYIDAEGNVIVLAWIIHDADTQNYLDEKGTVVGQRMEDGKYVNPVTGDPFESAEYTVVTKDANTGNYVDAVTEEVVGYIQEDGSYHSYRGVDADGGKKTKATPADPKPTKQKPEEQTAVDLGNDDIFQEQSIPISNKEAPGEPPRPSDKLVYKDSSTKDYINQNGTIVGYYQVDNTYLDTNGQPFDPTPYLPPDEQMGHYGTGAVNVDSNSNSKKPNKDKPDKQDDMETELQRPAEPFLPISLDNDIRTFSPTPQPTDALPKSDPYTTINNKNPPSKKQYPDIVSSTQGMEDLDMTVTTQNKGEISTVTVDIQDENNEDEQTPSPVASPSTYSNTSPYDPITEDVPLTVKRPALSFTGRGSDATTTTTSEIMQDGQSSYHTEIVSQDQLLSNQKDEKGGGGNPYNTVGMMAGGGDAYYGDACQIFDNVGFLGRSNEDEALMEVYYTNPLKCGGTIVEVGTGDGLTFSTSYYFEKAVGWRTLLIEADPIKFSALVRNRPNAIKANFAFCDSTSQALEYYDGAFHNPTPNNAETLNYDNDNDNDMSGRAQEGREGLINPNPNDATISSERLIERPLSTTGRGSKKDGDDTDATPAARAGSEEVIQVDCINFHELFKGNIITAVDVMVIHVPGDPLAVILQMDWQIVVDVFVIRMEPRYASTTANRMRNTMEEHGYVKALWDIRRWCGEDAGGCMPNEVYMRKDFNPHPLKEMRRKARQEAQPLTRKRRLLERMEATPRN